MRLLNSYVHKTVQHRRKVANLDLLTSQSLFSSSAVDVGTNLLLRVIEAHASRDFDTCIDVGCGYGPLGLSLAASGQAKSVEMVDRDALAVDFANLNAEKNGLSAAKAHASLGLTDTFETRYDLIVSNLPGKAGSAVLRDLVRSGYNRLSASGEFWGVVVNPIWPEVESVVDELDSTIVHVERGSRHTAFGFRRNGTHDGNTDAESLSEVYGRDSVTFTVAEHDYRIETTRGVHEFDGLSYSTQLALEHLGSVPRRGHSQAAVFNVSQGYLPMALLASGAVSSVMLVDRDLLSLRTATENLRRNGFETSESRLHHQVAWLPESTEFALITGVLRGDEPREAVDIGVESVADGLEPGGTAVIAGGSTPITRMLKSLDRRKDLRLVNRSRYRGSSAVTLQKSG